MSPIIYEEYIVAGGGFVVGGIFYSDHPHDRGTAYRLLLSVIVAILLALMTIIVRAEEPSPEKLLDSSNASEACAGQGQFADACSRGGEDGIGQRRCDRRRTRLTESARRKVAVDEVYSLRRRIP